LARLNRYQLVRLQGTRAPGVPHYNAIKFVQLDALDSLIPARVGELDELPRRDGIGAYHFRDHREKA
jgi:hypothetical protein